MFYCRCFIFLSNARSPKCVGWSVWNGDQQ